VTASQNRDRFLGSCKLRLACSRFALKSPAHAHAIERSFLHPRHRRPARRGPPIF